MATRRILASAIAFASDGVERGPDDTPTAFRIWRAGPNVTDYGTHIFSKQSAAALMAEQAMRGNLYSIDVDHLSLNEKAPPESRKAVGWHRLEARESPDGPELWAVDVEWTDAVRSGLASKPPEWRYFSPAYDVRDDGEIVSYLNTALTINPATHDVTALASRASSTEQRGNRMNLKECIAALFGDDDEKKKDAYAALAAMGEDEKKAALAALDADGDGDGDKKEAAKASEDGDGDKKAAKASEDGDGKKDDGDGDGDGKKEAKKASRNADAATLVMLGEQDARIAELEKEREANARKTILATRPDLTEAQRKFLEGKTSKEIETLLASPLLAKPGTNVRAASAQSGVRGTQGGRDTSVRAARSSPEEHKTIKERFGRADQPLPHWEGNDFVLPQLTRKQAHDILARHARDYGSDPTVPMRATSAVPTVLSTAAILQSMAQKAQVAS